MKFESPSRNIIEHLVFVVVVLVVGFLVGANIYYQRMDTKQKTLYYQLQIMRNAVNLYKVVEKKNPENLLVLAESIYSFPGDRETRKYLMNVPLDRGGKLVDPFGSMYIYDVKTGWVRTSTSGYEMW